MDPRDEAIDREAALEGLRRSHRQAATIAELRHRERLLRSELDAAEQRLELSLALGAKRPGLDRINAGGIKPHDAAFILLCSDWHVGERVDKESVSGRNEYTPAIAQRRLDKLIEGALWMIESWRSGKRGYGWKLDRVIVWLGGDIITGMIHDDLRESNFLSPTEEVLLASDMSRKLLNSIARHPGIAAVTVPCSWGNHGRDTPDRRVSTAWKRSYEWLMYKQLAREYESHKTIDVRIGQDEITRLDYLGWKLRFNHGDTFKFQGGVGGITIPAYKWLAKLDRTERADYTFIGHWHQALDVGQLTVNNCLIGFNAYGQRVGPYAAPSQVCCLLDRKWGKRMTSEIFV